MATFLIVHGGWSSAWVWRRLRVPMHSAGHDFHAPSLTGIGERGHLARPETDLSLHIRDVLSYIEFEDLHDVVLVGHSYGGMVATGVADAAPDRIRELVYHDAFVPRDGQCLADLQPEHVRQAQADAANRIGDGWRVPPLESTPDTSPEDLLWIAPRRTDQPIRTFLEPIRPTGAVDGLHRTYIYATRPRPYDVFRQFADRALAEPGWTYRTIDSTHSPNVTAPDLLMNVLAEVATDVVARAGASRAENAA